MKITFLGTAAAEGIPALFCNCQCCTEARRRGGKNLRTRSQSLINDDLLIVTKTAFAEIVSAIC